MRAARRAPSRPTAPRRERNPLKRSVQILELMVETMPETVGVREVATRLRMAPSTVHRSIALLERENLVSAEEGNGRYGLGLRFLRLVLHAQSRFPVAEIALPVMRSLVRATGETAYLSLYDRARAKMAFVASVESAQPVRYVVELNEWLPVNAGASGLAIMAHLRPDERAHVIRRGLQAVTPRTLTDPRELNRELGYIARKGFALTRGQRIPGAVGIAAAIHGEPDKVIGALAITIPEQRFVASAEAKLGRVVAQHARRIEEKLIGSSMRDPSAAHRA